ncbi:hypothetical protein [Azorhizobium caulinodans]|uniref:hypothetical protein n=3 Tax=Azorhizobium caulinodans TaxID=7 RepID=UPI002FBDFBB9
MAIDTAKFIGACIHCTYEGNAHKAEDIYIGFSDGAFDTNKSAPYGVFPNLMMVLLILIKNKLQYDARTKNVITDRTVKEFTLKHLIINDDYAKYKEYISYSTLPFVYLCDNGLGVQNGNYINIQDYRTALPTKASCVGLDRASGTFFIYPDKGTATPRPEKPKFIDLSVWNGERDEPKNAIATSILRSLNADFTSDDKGAPLLNQLYVYAQGLTCPMTHGDAFAEVLSGIVNRWNEYRDDQKDKAPFNIGSGLFLRLPPTADTVLASNDRSVRVMLSPNNKNKNRASHAEVKVPLLLNFLSYCGFGGDSKKDGNAGWIAGYNKDKVNNAIKILTQHVRDGGHLFMFSSLLPCYMCEGSIDSTISGDGELYKEINGYPINLYPGFPETKFHYTIDITYYYDIDDTINYRRLYANQKTNSSRYQGIQMQIVEVPYSAYIPATGRVISRADADISVEPMAVPDAGQTAYGVGLHNQKTIMRYRLAADCFTSRTITSYQILQSPSPRQVMGAPEGSGQIGGNDNPVQQRLDAASRATALSDQGAGSPIGTEPVALPSSGPEAPSNVATETATQSAPQPVRRQIRLPLRRGHLRPVAGPRLS